MNWLKKRDIFTYISNKIIQRKSEVAMPKPRDDHERDLKGAEVVGMTTGKGGEKVSNVPIFRGN